MLARWEREGEYYRTGGLSFIDESQRRELLEKVDAALNALRYDLRPVSYPKMIPCARGSCVDQLTVLV